MGKTQVYKWFAWLKCGDIAIDDKPWSGRPLIARIDDNLEKNREFVLTDHRVTIDELSDSSQFSVTVKFVLWTLNDNQKEHWVGTCRALKQRLKLLYIFC